MTDSVEIISHDKRAVFAPGRGMNMISLQSGGVECIDQSTRSMFDSRYGGLGAMIGPHFHYRPENQIPQIMHEERFPHIQVSREQGAKDPFSHGIGRYAPWKVQEYKQGSVKATLDGDMKWQDMRLADLEGQNFFMRYEAEVVASGLHIELAIESEHSSIIGLHTYYYLPRGTGTVHSCVRQEGLPDGWFSSPNQLMVTLPQVVDQNFHPEGKGGMIRLDTGAYQIILRYESDDEDHSWQLWQPKGVQFVCIEPLSSRNPKRCQRNKSQLKIHISTEAYG